MPISKVFSNALPPNAPNITLTVSDLYGLGDGNLAAGRQRIALFGSLERVQEEEEEGCRKAYLEGEQASEIEREEGADPPCSIQLTPMLVVGLELEVRISASTLVSAFTRSLPLYVSSASPAQTFAELAPPHRTDSATSPSCVPLSSFPTHRLTPFVSLQIGWLPLDLYRASGKLMRSRKEVLKHWREPVQPEELGMREEMFAETVGEVEEERERLRIQW